ncbi:Ldh family oxidoreductase [Aestuariivita boseongensis]|uniref:Ldh family oxidoreductase n=1 Tax=Aestuariivita boseongensis TaxID=1470562 RepID=UPI00067F9220|nr:Ldh family oxidoreductase [Aestuariivita boseongensis]
MTEVSLKDIHAVTSRALTAHGAAEWVAHAVADAVAEAEATGNRICGLYYLESYCQQLRTGRVKGDVDPVVTRPRPGVVQVDGKLGFAQSAFQRALPQALEAAREMGTVQLAVGHTHTCTSLGFFTGQIARAGMIALGMTNASPIVAPPGGKTRVIGTNPIAFSVPDGQGGVAMQFDQSTTTVALGKITMAKAAGERIPEGWAVDADGRPTTDPEAALAGSLVSMGGYKGWGFGLMAELLAAGMTGSVTSREVRPLKAPEGPPHDLGQFYLIIDPSAAPGFAETVRRVADAVAEDAGARMPGQNRVLNDPVSVDPVAWDLALQLAG